MKITELFEVSQQPAVVAPGAEIKPIPPGSKPSGDNPTSPTQSSSAESSKPVPPPNQAQPVGFPSNIPQQQTQTIGQAPQQQQATQPASSTAAPVDNSQNSDNIQNLQNQMQALMMKINQIQGTQMKPGAQ